MKIHFKYLCTLFFIISSFSLFTSCIDMGKIFESDYVYLSAVNKNATDITENSAILNASVQSNSENANVSFHIWICDTSGSLNAQTIQANPGYIPSGTKWTSVNAKATGLTSKTTYCFSIFIENDHSMYPAGSFTTL
jgi:hypothetical protein